MSLWSADGKRQISGFPTGNRPVQNMPSPSQPKAQPFSAWGQTPNPFGQQFGGTFTPGGGAGNMAYAQPNQRPQPFTQSATFGGQQFGNAGDAFAMRDAFIQAANQSKAPFAQGWGSGASAPPATDINALMRQAGDMVQGGWTNPFAPPMPNMGSLNNYGYGDTRPPLKSQAQPIQPPSQVVPYSPGTSFYPGGPSQAQPIQPPSQGTPYGPGTSFYPGGPAVAPPAQRQIPPQGVTPVLGAPQVWTNPSDPDWLKQQLQRKPDSRPVVWDERNRRYINNPTFVGAPGYDWPPQQQSYWHALSR